jgi:hypothetical protein
VSFVVRAAEPAEYADAGRVTAEAYHADDLLRRTDGLIDLDYEAQLTEASRRAREAVLLVAVDDGQVLVPDALGCRRWAAPWLWPGARQGVSGSSPCGRNA